MIQRTNARQIALQYLYQLDLRGKEILPQMSLFIAKSSDDRITREYAKKLILGCIEQKERIEEKIVSLAKNWTISRMAVVDRNILRIAIYELCYCAEVPPKVAVDEAIEMGKQFSTENSGPFINGILDNLVPKKKKQKEKNERKV